MAKREQKTEMWPIRRLKKHPQQDALFPELPDAEFEAFKQDMQLRKQQKPIEILPDGTIVAGHQRVRAAKALGWTEVEVVVRHDLAQRGEDAIVAHLIRDNLIPATVVAACPRARRISPRRDR
jgi:ParB-like chromosome segregation protein Spo0J